MIPEPTADDLAKDLGKAWYDAQGDAHAYAFLWWIRRCHAAEQNLAALRAELASVRADTGKALAAADTGRCRAAMRSE